MPGHRYSFIFLSAISYEACVYRDHFFHIFNFFLSQDFHELWGNMMNTHPITKAKQQYVRFVLGWMTIHLGISFCRQTFINSSAQIVSLMAL